MGRFSEESVLLIQNWETVQDILQAEKRLRQELSTMLNALAQDLRQADWWEDGWRFVQPSEAQIYISHQAWQADGESVVWIGIEDFAPNQVFGLEIPPNLYVWVSGRRNDLAQALIEELEREGGYLGELDYRASGYVVRQALQKCLPEEIQSYETGVREQTVAFFEFYARNLRQYDDLIAAFIEK